ncbi:MAG: hypothetical protein QM723_19905 [Myxococcaceae bacterium]
MRARAATLQVVNLSEARVGRRLDVYRNRLETVLASNKLAIGKLYSTGVLFTREGTRAGRELLVAHEHLLRVMRLIDRLAGEGDVPAPKKQSSVEAVFQELDLLLERTQELSDRTGEVIELLKR